MKSAFPPRAFAARALSLIVLACFPASAPATMSVDPDVVTRAIVRIRQALPEDWEMTENRWEVVPQGWTGPAESVYLKLEDRSLTLRHPAGFDFHPFYKLWILPRCWEGRMEVASIDPSAPQALYFGENVDFRVLYRTMGATTWDAARDELAFALDLVVFPLSHTPRHSLDVGAMQVLFQRLDTAGDLSRWHRQIYGIQELPEMIYLELLTWEDRDGEQEDPTFLGSLAEQETRYLTREVLAAFPQKKSLYLRRVTQGTFSDVLVVNPACLAPTP